MSSHRDDQFQETRWTLIQKTEDPHSAVRLRALNSLCSSYWKPLYWFLRRSGESPEDAADLVQGFFARLLQGEQLQRVDRKKGRLRTYFLALLKGHVSDCRKRANALKRGGETPDLRIDAEEGEAFLARAIDSTKGANSVEEEFDRHWARAVLEAAMGMLNQEMGEKGKGELFQALRPRLLGEEKPSTEEIAGQLGKEPGAIRVALHRMRERLRDLLRKEVADTLTPDEDLQAELRYLAKMLAP